MLDFRRTEESGNYAGTDELIKVGSEPAPVTASEVSKLWKLRKLRGEFLPSSLFADPGWDMLLYLYSTDLSPARTTVKGVVQASNVPETTALRWLSALVSHGLCEKRQDPIDARRQFVSLTAEGRKAMDQYFTAVTKVTAPMCSTRPV